MPSTPKPPTDAADHLDEPSDDVSGMVLDNDVVGDTAADEKDVALGAFGGVDGRHEDSERASNEVTKEATRAVLGMDEQRFDYSVSRSRFGGRNLVMPCQHFVHHEH